ncbi:hypothetical protein DSECCO2_498840 [anaerobic digester metagenome]
MDPVLPALDGQIPYQDAGECRTLLVPDENPRNVTYAGAGEDVPFPIEQDVGGGDLDGCMLARAGDVGDEVVGARLGYHDRAVDGDRRSERDQRERSENEREYRADHAPFALSLLLHTVFAGRRHPDGGTA